MFAAKEMEGTEALTYVTDYTQETDGSYVGIRSVRPYPGGLSIAHLTGRYGYGDINDLYENNDFIDEESSYYYFFENYFDVKE